MPERKYDVLFICWPNSARSIIAEAVLNRLHGDRFRAFSAGVQPAEHLHPETTRLLSVLGYDLTTLHPKSWDLFAAGSAMDFIFTLCDDAAGEDCPAWPGQPMTAHWGIANPALATGNATEIAIAFNEAFKHISRRIELFAALPLHAIDQLTLHGKLREIGRSEGATAMAAAQS